MKGNKNFWYMSIGSLISLIGSGIQMVAIPLYILDATGSGTLMGLFSIISLVPMLVFAPFSGIIGDRKNRKTIMVWTDYGRGALICLMGIMAVMNVMNIYILFFAQVFVSIMDSLFNNSSKSILPEIVTNEELMQANSLKGSFDAISMLVGPVLGGILYGLWGIKIVFLLNGISFIASGILEMLMVYAPKINEKQKMSAAVFLSETKEALTFIFKHKGLMQLFSYAMIVNLITVPMLTVLYAYVFRKVIGFNAQQYGMLQGSFTAGFLVGNIAMAVKLSKLGAKKLMRLGIISMPIFIIIIALFPMPGIMLFFSKGSWILFGILAGIFIITGAVNSFVNVPLSTNLQKLVPGEIRSRVFAVLGIFSQGAIPLGSLICGILLDKVKPHMVLLSASLLFLAVSVIFVVIAIDEAYEPKNNITLQSTELTNSTI